ncbi:uncharacterized protein CLUP02_07012 [Colletotrichum lupini]|uniref:Uncharacterized protein n=1 Tax=Colletotrichum lupini TaxID=145971 RepID=A0A9Q8SQB8_9PEZI|nr:uncharacterized protein CLUP02_07012 [Colletotrichum lupini]UQC81526.1 hypothetical protein CLUP02_07012 [Colletotrichum lupini]
MTFRILGMHLPLSLDLRVPRPTQNLTCIFAQTLATLTLTALERRLGATPEPPHTHFGRAHRTGRPESQPELLRQSAILTQHRPSH